MKAVSMFLFAGMICLAASSELADDITVTDWRRETVVATEIVTPSMMQWLHGIE